MKRRLWFAATATACAMIAIPCIAETASIGLFAHRQLMSRDAAAGFAALPQSIVPLGNNVHILGAARASDPVSFTVALHPRQFNQLAALIAEGGRPTPGELSSRFLPTEASYTAVLRWLQSAGLKVDRIFPTRLMVAASGSVTSVGRALAVRFVRVSMGGRTYVSAVNAPVLPKAVASLVTSINGLQPHLRYHPEHIRVPRTPTNQGYTPAGLRKAYNATNLTQNGKGTTTAILIDTVPLGSDLTSYWQATNTPQTLNNITAINVTGASLPPPSGEESIDVEMSSSMAPASKVRIYATATLAFTAIDNGYEAIILDAVSGIPIHQVSISLGACEAGVSSGQVLTDIYYHAILDALGATVLIASGDSGSQECGSGNGNIPAFDSTSPYVTAVGGTTLKLTKTGSFKETAWSGSGGGISVYFSKPAFQANLNLPGRGVPDVAAVGDPATGVAIVLNGQVQVFGGTSVATPIWAGLMGLVNQARFAAGKPSLGFMDGRVYPLLGTKNFRDIVSGSNGGFSAGTGYDLVTGVGTPLMNNLLPTLKAQS